MSENSVFESIGSDYIQNMHNDNLLQRTFTSPLMMVLGFLIAHDLISGFVGGFSADFDAMFSSDVSELYKSWSLLLGETSRRMWMAILGVILLMRVELFESLGSFKKPERWDRKPALYLFLGATVVVQTGFPNILYGLSELPFSLVLMSMVADMSIGVEEEIWFRGVAFLVLLRAWGTSRSAVLAAIFVSAALFGIWHMGNFLYGQPLPETVMQVIYTFFLGIIFACLYLICGSIWVPIIAHGVFDFGASISYLWASGSEGRGSEQTFADAFLAYGGFIALVFVLAILSLKYLASIEDELRQEFDL